MPSTALLKHLVAELWASQLGDPKYDYVFLSGWYFDSSLFRA